MKKDYDNFEERLLSLACECDNIDVYVDDVNGKYGYKRSCNDKYKYVDRIETDGFFTDEDCNSCFLEDANYAIIRTYEGKEIKKISYILSPMLYGIVSSYVLRKGDEKLISMLENNKKGDLNNFESLSDDSSFAICPYTNQTSVVRKLEY
ncbi:MAG: hypothetical protein ACI31R_03220 [Bacilli bacterium]